MVGPTTLIFQKLIFTNTKTSLQNLHSNSFYLVKKFPPWGISILADFRPMGYKLLCCGSIWSRLEPFIFKSILGRRAYLAFSVHPSFVI